MIKDLLVHLDHTPGSPARLEAALALAAACGAQVTALYLLAEPFLRGVAGLHAPAEVIREHLAHAGAEAEAAFAAARELAARRDLTVVTRRETGSVDRLPTLVVHLDEDILPVLEGLKDVGTDVHDLVDTVQDLRQVVKGFPGSKLFRRRGREEIADEADNGSPDGQEAQERTGS